MVSLSNHRVIAVLLRPFAGLMGYFFSSGSSVLTFLLYHKSDDAGNQIRWFLAVFARIEDLCGQSMVLGGRGGDDDGLDVGIGEQCVEIIGYRGVRVVFGHLLADGAGLVADGFENSELMKIPDKILTPVPGADEGDVRL
jgi:hypothetical protein